MGGNVTRIRAILAFSDRASSIATSTSWAAIGLSSTAIKIFSLLTSFPPTVSPVKDRSFPPASEFLG